MPAARIWARNRPWSARPLAPAGNRTSAAVGVAADGSKHVLGLVEGATEHSEAVKHLLVDLVERGVRPTRRVTHWKNGAMALRWAAASGLETEKSSRKILGYEAL